MSNRRLFGLCLIATPLIIWGGVEYFGYEWIWNRTTESVPIGIAAASFSFLVMVLGIYFTSATQLAFVARAFFLFLVICAIQLFSVFMAGGGMETVAVNSSRDAITQRLGSFGNYWTDLSTTEKKWLILRKTRHLAQYESGIKPRMRVEADGTLAVELHSWGAVEKPDVKVDRFPPSSLAP